MDWGGERSDTEFPDVGHLGALCRRIMVVRGGGERNDVGHSASLCRWIRVVRGGDRNFLIERRCAPLSVDRFFV